MLRGAVPVLCLFLAGCAGPIMANSAIFRAQGALHEAEALGAQEKAIYQYTLGVHLLNKAWEEQAHSSYQTSLDLATQAERAFKEAQRQVSTLGTGQQPIPESKPSGDSNTSGDSSWGGDLD